MNQASFPLPEIDVSTVPIVDHINESDILRAGARFYLDQGYLIIKNAFDEGFLRQAYREYIEGYEKYFSKGKIK